MPVIVPESLESALAALTAYPDATVLAGGTDLMVEVNDGRRPRRARGRVGRVPELRGGAWTATTSCSAPATTYTELLERRSGRPARTRARVRRAHRRLAADPQRGHDRRQPRHGVPGGRRAAGPGRARRVGRDRFAPAGALVPIDRVLRRPEAHDARARRADRGGAGARTARPAGLPEGRRAQRDGDRRRVARLAVDLDGRSHRVSGWDRSGRRRSPLAEARPRGSSGGSTGARTASRWPTTTTVDAFGERVAAAARPIDDHRTAPPTAAAHAVAVLARLRRCGGPRSP